MTVLEQLAALIRQSYPQLNYHVEGSGIQVLPASSDGFVVGFQGEAPDYTVYFGTPGWHNHFSGTGLQDALFWFALGLSDQTRLKILSRGKKDYAWVLQRKTDNAWMQIAQSTTIWTAFWKPTKTRYLSNNWPLNPARFVGQIDVATFVKEGERIDQQRRDSAANRSIAKSAVVMAFVLGAIQLAEGVTYTGWQQAISLVIGMATVIVGVALFVRYRGAD